MPECLAVKNGDEGAAFSTAPKRVLLVGSLEIETSCVMCGRTVGAVIAFVTLKPEVAAAPQPGRDAIAEKVGEILHVSASRPGRIRPRRSRR